MTASIGETLAQYKIIPVLVLEDLESGLKRCELLCECGLPVAEITFRTQAAESVIREASKRFPEMFLGAGTVLNTADLHRAFDAGAKFAVAPGFNPTVVKEALKCSYAFAPGICTPSEIEQAYKNVIRNQVDGIITCDYHPEWIQEKIPVVVYGKQYPETDCISIDYSTAFSEAAEYLCSLGHSRFGYIGCHGERYENYAAVMDKYGLADSDYVFDGMGYPENGIKGMQFFLRMEKPPTAIFCHNDSVALSAMAEAQRNGLEIGSDISIIGIDNTLESGFSYPALTTIDTFIGQKAGIMVDLLLERFGAPEKKAVSLTLKSKLIIRKSCGPARERT